MTSSPLDPTDEPLRAVIGKKVIQKPAIRAPRTVLATVRFDL